MGGCRHLTHCGKAGFVDGRAFGKQALLLATEDARLFRYFAVDLTTGVRMARAVMRDMLSLRGGSIFFASIESGVQPQPWMMHYGAIKTCLLGVSRALAE